MQRFKVDVSDLSVEVDGVEPRVDKDGNQVKNKDGQPKFVVHVFVREAGRQKSDQWSVTVLNEPKITKGQVVRLVGVYAFAWEQNGKSGVALTAESITALPAARSATAS